MKSIILYAIIASIVTALATWIFLRRRVKNSDRYNSNGRVVGEDQIEVVRILRDISKAQTQIIQELQASKATMIVELKSIKAASETENKLLDRLILVIESFSEEKQDQAASAPAPARNIHQEQVGVASPRAFANSQFANDEWEALEGIAREYLRQADLRELGRFDIERFFGENAVRINFVNDTGDSWSMIAVYGTNSSSAVGIPAIRVGMLRINLTPFFEILNHNGVDPIKGKQVLRFARLVSSQGSWAAAEKGVIDAAQ